MKRCRILQARDYFLVQTKVLFFWFTEYELRDDEYSLVSPDLYGPLHFDIKFDSLTDALDYINKKYPNYATIVLDNLLC